MVNLKKQKTWTGISMLIVAIMLIVTVMAASFSKRISTIGNIKTVGIDVFADQACTVPLTQFNWGFLSPGETAYTLMFIKNSGNVNVTLSFTVSEWNPSGAAAFLQSSWNVTSDYVVKPLQFVAARVSLTVSMDITGITGFSYVMTIMAIMAG